jgi:hypothetical protein
MWLAQKLVQQKAYIYWRPQEKRSKYSLKKSSVLDLHDKNVEHLHFQE